MIDPPRKIGPDETLGHQINSATRARQCRNCSLSNRSLHWRAMFETRCRSDISVDRLHPDWYVDVTQVARQLQQTFYGWAVVTPNTAQELGRDLEPARTTANPYHANILLPDRDESTRREHATSLASRAWWQPVDEQLVSPPPLPLPACSAKS